MSIEQHSQLLQHYPLLIVFIGALLSGETMVLIATFICYKNGVSINLIIFSTIIGAIIANQIWYYIGEKYGEKILLNHPSLNKDTLKFRHWIKNMSTFMALASRFIFGAGIIVPLLLGSNKFPKFKFVGLNILGAILWGILLVEVGVLFGRKALSYIETPSYIEYGLFVIVFLLIMDWCYKHRYIHKTIKGSSDK